MWFLDPETHAAWYAAEQGSSLAATLRFARAYRQHRESFAAAGLKGAEMSVADFFAHVGNKRKELARG